MVGCEPVVQRPMCREYGSASSREKGYVVREHWLMRHPARPHALYHARRRCGPSAVVVGAAQTRDVAMAAAAAAAAASANA